MLVAEKKIKHPYISIDPKIAGKSGFRASEASATGLPVGSYKYILPRRFLI